MNEVYRLWKHCQAMQVEKQVIRIINWNERINRLCKYWMHNITIIRSLFNHVCWTSHTSDGGTIKSACPYNFRLGFEYHHGYLPDQLLICYCEIIIINNITLIMSWIDLKSIEPRGRGLMIRLVTIVTYSSGRETNSPTKKQTVVYCCSHLWHENTQSFFGLLLIGCVQFPVQFKYFDNPDEEDSIAHPIQKATANDNWNPSWSIRAKLWKQGKLTDQYAAVDSR